MSASAGASTLSGEQAKTNSVEASAGGGSGASSAPPLPVNRREFRRASEGGITSTDYGIEGILGEGGMGVVYRSRQSSLARSVAIKMVRPDLEVTPEISSSLISEAVLTGFLEHPNIVPVYDLAADQDGKLFYSMLQVQGTPWQDVITQKSELENLEILLRVSDAVAFAHSRGVIHRDLKPENVVLGQYGEVRVLDWGVAFMTPDCPQQQVITNSTRLQCTPSYAAPELLIGPATRIGPASDVYLLGAILYQIVTGTTPHTGGDLGECLQNVVTNTIHPTETTGELVEIALRAMQTEPEDRYRSAQEFSAAVRVYISHYESLLISNRAKTELPTAVSTRDYELFSAVVFRFREASELWAGNREAVAGLRRARMNFAECALEKGDLDLAESQLEQGDREHGNLLTRIRSARAQRDAREHKLRLAKWLGGTVVALALTGMSMLWWHASDLAIEAKKSAEEANTLKEQADKSAEEAITLKEQADNSAKQANESAEEAEKRRYFAEMFLASERIRNNEFGSAREILDRYADRKDLISWEWQRLDFLRSRGERLSVADDHIVIPPAAESVVTALAISQRSGVLFTGHADGCIRVTPLGSEQSVELKGLQLQPSAGGAVAVSDLAVSAEHLAAAVGSQIVLWDLTDSGALPRRLEGHRCEVTSVCLSEQSKLLVSTSSDHRVCLWDLSGASDAAISAIVLEGHTSAVRDAAITPDSRYIVSVGDDQRAIVWRRQDASGGESIRYRRVADFLEHAAAVEAVAIQPNPTADCLLVATTGQDRTIRLWNAVSLFEDFDDAAFSKTRLPNLIAGSPPAEVPHRFLIGHQQDVRKLIFSKDGRFLLSGSDDHTLKVWDVTAGQLYRTLRGHSGGVQCCDLYEDGSTRAAVSGDHTAQLLRWNIDSHHEEDLVQDSAGQLGALLAAVVSENETRIATTGENHAINLWEPRSNGGVPASFVLTEGHEFLASRAEFLQHGDRRLIMTASLDGTTRLWDQVTGAQLAVMTGTGSNQVLAEVAANGEWILTGSNSATGPGALLWSVRDLLEASDQPPENRIVHPIARCPVDEEKITAIAFSPDSEWLFVAGERGRGLVCRVSSGQVETICEIAGHSSSLEAAAFVMIDDQLRLVTTAANGEIAQWNAANGHFLTPHMPVHASPVKRLAISSTLALAVTVTVSDDSRPGSQSGCTLHAYDLRTGRRVHQQLLTGKLLSSVRFSSDGMRLIATLQDFSANRDSVLTWLLRRGDDGQVQFPDSVEWPGSASLAGRFESSVLNAEASELLLVGGNLAQLLRIDGLDPGQEDTTELIMLYGSGAAVNGACFRRNGRLLVSAGQNGWITVWDTLLKRSVARHLGRRNRAITSIQPNPGSADQFLTVDGAGLMEFWELNDSGQPALADPNRTLQITAAGAVRVAAFSPDGQQLATAGSDETIRIWRHDPQTGWTEQFQSSMSGILKNMSAIAFDATAERLLVGGVDQLAILYPTMDPRPLVVEAHTGPITAVSFAPDGKRAVSGGVDHNLKLWKVDMPAEFSRPDTNQTTPSSVLTEVLTLRRHTDEVTDVRFCGKLPGSPILSCSRDGTAVLWLTKDDQNSGVGAANRRLSP